MPQTLLFLFVKNTWPRNVQEWTRVMTAVIVTTASAIAVLAVIVGIMVVHPIVMMRAMTAVA